MIRKAITAAAVLGIGTVALAPGSAHAGGPTDICNNSAGISQNVVGEQNSVNAAFAYNNDFVLTGLFIQNGNQSVSAYWVSWRTQIAGTNKVIVGARNDTSGPNTATGWMVETYVC